MAVKEAVPRYRRINYLSLDERLDQGRTARDRTPASSHGGWSPAADRPDPVGLLEEQDRTREPDLVPVRHGRMMVSPFTFYRGAARIMAADLAGTPVAGLGVQLCGDAHLMAPITLTYYARLCGWTLARAHARSGDPVATAEYLAGDDAFDQSIADFCERYADQNEQDSEEFGKAVRSGRLEAVEGV
jgi:hypothetical protein